MKSQRRQFITKVLLLAAPLIVLVWVYVVSDPFKVLRKYDTYHESGKPDYFTLNQGVVGVEMFLRNYGKYRYDSFIFGSSRSMFYRIADWKRQISATECFHFDSYSESLYGIYKKFEFLQQRGVSIKNALIILDADTLSRDVDSNKSLLIQHPLLTGQANHAFQMQFFQGFLNENFLISFLDFKLRGKVQPYMKKGHAIDDTLKAYDSVTNETSFDFFEAMIARDKNEFYSSKKDMFYDRDAVQQYSYSVIGRKHLMQLQYIKSELDRQKTNYKIVISPLYDQKKINQKDLESLYRIFGVENVFDFSGINEMTASMYNYYDSFHYRPHIAKVILDQIY